MKFESLIELVNYYMKYALYRKVKLSYPVSKDIVKRMGNLSLLEDDNAYSSSGYMDPSTVARDKVTVKALYDYKAQQEDELSFCKHAIITNVDKNNQLWWQGDYGGKIQHYFPANYVIEISGGDGIDGDENSSDSLLGNLQKGTIDVSGAVVELAVMAGGEVEWMIRIHTPTMQNFFEVGAQTKEIAVEWRNAIMEAAQNASVLENERRKLERNSKVAKEMSDLIIYCRSVPFKNAGWLFYEMSSFAETKAEKFFLQQEMNVSWKAFELFLDTFVFLGNFRLISNALKSFGKCQKSHEPFHRVFEPVAIDKHRRPPQQSANTQI
jgi:phosphatidylinositol phospholipase C gamma-1